MSGQVPKAMRAYFRQHNRRVIGIASLMLGLSLALWGLLYFLFYWSVLFVLSLVQGIEAQAPDEFSSRFLMIAGGLCGLSLLHQNFWPHPKIGDRKNAFATAIDVIFAVPNMTISALYTLAAYRSLGEGELFAAWRLLGAIAREGSLPMQQVPLEVPGNSTRNNVLMALQLSGLIEVKADSQGVRLQMLDERGRRFGQEYVRIKIKYHQ